MSEPTEFRFPPLGAAPGYLDLQRYSRIWGEMRLWEGDGWQEESISWKQTAYLGANLIGRIETVISGPDAQVFLSRISINNVSKWPIGRSKHLVMLNDEGLIACHALAVRDGEQRFRTLASPPWPMFQQHRFDFDVTVELNEIFVLQVAGPVSLQILETVLGKSLRDVAFLDVVPAKIPGVDADVELELSRIGMAGTLAYEIRGPLAQGPAVYDAVYQAGKPLGIKRLGWRTYPVNHTEAGYPQLGVTWLPAMMLDPAVQASPLGAILAAPPTGSIDPADIRARLRTPQEVNWAWMCKFDHDFVGREAMEAEAAAPRRKTVILRWNPEDLVDVFASQFEQGEPYKFMEFPSVVQQPAGAHADLVTKDGVPVGVSSAAIYSYHFREMISQTAIDLEHAEIGTEVVVHWGDHGKRIKEVRATVERFPYLDLPDNRTYDLSTVPSGV
ncbi:hypothetical protein ACWKWP_08730 [Agromyces soli]